MPRGGWRGGGRPSNAAKAEKERQLAEAIAAGPKTPPRVLLQGIMDSPGSTKMEKMKAVELYLKLPPESPPPSSADNSERSLTIYSVPRGSSIDFKTGEIVIPDGVVPQTVEPFTATHDWTRRAASTSKREHDVETMPVETPPTESAYDEDNLSTAPLPAATAPPASNVRPLRPHERTYFEGERHDVTRRPATRDPFRFKPHDPFDAA